MSYKAVSSEKIQDDQGRVTRKRAEYSFETNDDSKRTRVTPNKLYEGLLVSISKISQKNIPHDEKVERVYSKLAVLGKQKVQALEDKLESEKCVKANETLRVTKEKRSSADFKKLCDDRTKRTSDSLREEIDSRSRSIENHTLHILDAQCILANRTSLYLEKSLLKQSMKLLRDRAFDSDNDEDGETLLIENNHGDYDSGEPQNDQDDYDSGEPQNDQDDYDSGEPQNDQDEEA
jgi:hypothetical protein